MHFKHTLLYLKFLTESINEEALNHRPTIVNNCVESLKKSLNFRINCDTFVYLYVHYAMYIKLTLSTCVIIHMYTI